MKSTLKSYNALPSRSKSSDSRQNLSKSMAIQSHGQRKKKNKYWLQHYINAMHSKWLISNGNRKLTPVGIFANSNYLDLNLVAIYKNSNYFRCMKLTTKYLCTDVYNYR